MAYSGADALSNTSQVAIAVLTIWIWGLICYLRINYRDILSHISSFLQITLALAIIIAVTVGANNKFNSADYVFLTGNLSYHHIIMSCHVVLYHVHVM